MSSWTSGTSGGRGGNGCCGGCGGGGNGARGGNGGRGRMGRVSGFGFFGVSVFLRDFLGGIFVFFSEAKEISSVVARLSNLHAKKKNLFVCLCFERNRKRELGRCKLFKRQMEGESKRGHLEIVNFTPWPLTL